MYFKREKWKKKIVVSDKLFLKKYPFPVTQSFTPVSWQAILIFQLTWQQLCDTGVPSSKVPACNFNCVFFFTTSSFDRQPSTRTRTKILRNSFWRVVRSILFQLNLYKTFRVFLSPFTWTTIDIYIFFQVLFDMPPMPDFEFNLFLLAFHDTSLDFKTNLHWLDSIVDLQ